MASDKQPLCYFDLGAWNSWDFVDYSTPTPTLNMSMLNKYVTTLIAQLKNSRVPALALSFAQLCDLQTMAIDDLANCSHTNSLWMLYKNTDGALTPDSGQNILQYFMEQLKEEDISAVLSFGGAAATGKDFNFGFSETFSPSDAVSAVCSLLRLYDIGGIDFDLETTAMNMVSDNGASNLSSFFHELHESVDVPITYTVMGQVNLWGTQGSAFHELFSQDIAFSDMFDGVNLMLYNGQYYIDANNSSWGLDQWLEDLSKQMGISKYECAPYLHIGYNSVLDYTNPSTSAGHEYHIPQGLSNGAAAAWIQDRVQSELREALETSDLTLNEPIFWEGNANYGVGKDGASLFISDSNSFEEQFLTYQLSFATAE